MKSRIFLSVIATAALSACAAQPSPDRFAVVGPVVQTEQIAGTFLEKSIILAAVENMPKKLGGMMFSSIKRDEYESSLRRSFESHNLLADDPTQATYRVTPVFQEFLDKSKMIATNASGIIFDYKIELIADNSLIKSKRVHSRFRAKPTGLGAAIIGGLGPAITGTVAGQNQTITQVQSQRASDEAAARTLQAELDQTPYDSFAVSGPGPWDGSLRVKYVRQRAVRLNIAMAIRDIVAVIQDSEKNR